jgi:hypothetical protein
MLKDRILRSASRRFICESASIVGGILILMLATMERLTVQSTVLWIAAPLILLSLMDAGYAAEQCRIC